MNKVIKMNTRKRNQLKEARLEIVSDMFKRGFSIPKIRAEVMRRLNRPTCSMATIHSDIQTLLQEWREARLSDMDDALQLELARIDDAVRELWDQWEKSKEDYTRTLRKRKGAPERDRNNRSNSAAPEGLRTYAIEETTQNVAGLGNPYYISEIRAQLAERRKLLGLYAPEKKDISGEASFTSYLIESGLIDDAAQPTEPKDPE